jgi:ATP-dependent Lhr-like helicase
LREEKTKRRVSIAVDHFIDTGTGEDDYYRALYRETRGRRCIIFTNSRIEAEKVTASLGKIAKKCGGQDRFYIHHGSIAAGHRHETERELRESPLPISAAATATLEMGLDIGALDRVMQIGPPSSVSAFVQRLGRSGRMRKKPEIYFSSLEEKRSWEHPVNALPWGLIKTIAIIELYIREKWIEPGAGNPLPYSLLLHQTLSVLCSLGGFRPAALARSILALPAFSHVSEGDFAKLLSHLASSSFIEKTDEGILIAGIEAEKLCSHYSFYSVFPGAAEYRVLAGGREIGRINFIPPEGCNIVLGGRYWLVENSSYGQAAGERDIMVSPGEAGSRQVWRGSGIELHRKVAAYMRKIVSDNADYPYLSPSAKGRLACAREIAKQWNLAEEIFIPAEGPSPECPFDAGADASGPDETSGTELFVLLPWMGSRGLRTLLLILQNKNYRKTLCVRSLSRENDFSLNICSSLPIPRFRAELSDIIKRHRNLESLYPLIEADQLPMLGKFDLQLPPALLVKQYAAAMLDSSELKAL